MHFKFCKNFFLKSRYWQFFVLLGFLFFYLLSCKPTITRKKSNEAEIKTFTLAGKKATINGKDISFESFSYGSDVTGLTATYTISKGATIKPNPSTATDYTSPVTFTVTAEDGTKKNYKVTVTVSLNSEAKITAFALGGVTGRIDQTKKTIVVPMPYNKTTHAPYGKDLTSIAGAMTISKDATVNKRVTNPQDYSNPITYTVTSQDKKSTTDYTVTVMVQVTDANRFEVVYDEIKRLEPNHSKKDGGGKDIVKVIDVDLNHLDLFEVTTLKDMFSGMDPVTGNRNRDYLLARKFNGDVRNWNVANVTNMTSTLSGTLIFDKPLDWNVSNVESMSMMFTASGFNQPLNHWNVSKVTSMDGMFDWADKFDQPLNRWNTSKVTDMGSMFKKAEAFNQNISMWDVRKVTAYFNFAIDATAFQEGNKPKFVKP